MKMGQLSLNCQLCFPPIFQIWEKYKNGAIRMCKHHSDVCNFGEAVEQKGHWTKKKKRGVKLRSRGGTVLYIRQKYASVHRKGLNVRLRISAQYTQRR